jgi:hypothetical protein
MGKWSQPRFCDIEIVADPISNPISNSPAGGKTGREIKSAEDLTLPIAKIETPPLAKKINFVQQVGFGSRIESAESCLD